MGKQGNKKDNALEFSENKKVHFVEIKNTGKIVIEGVPDWLVYKKDSLGFHFSLKRNYNYNGSVEEGDISFYNSSGKLLVVKHVKYKVLEAETNAETNRETKKVKNVKPATTNNAENIKKDSLGDKPDIRLEPIEEKSEEIKIGQTLIPLPPKPIRLTLHINSQSTKFTVSKDANIRLEIVESGSLRLDSSSDPKNIQIPQKMVLPKSMPLIDLINQFYIYLKKSLIDLSPYEQDKLSRRLISLSELSSSPNDMELLKKFMGLEEEIKVVEVKPEQSSEVDYTVVDETDKKLVDETKLDISQKESVEESSLIEDKQEIQDITTVEAEDDIQKLDENEYSCALQELRKAIQNLTYKEKESDIKFLDGIIEKIKSTLLENFDNPLLTNLMDWGINVYKRKQNESQHLPDDVWQLYAQIMNDPFNVFVIWKTNTSFNNNDHVVDGNSFGLDYNAIVTKVIEPGFKVSARVRENQGKIIKKARVLVVR